MRPSKILDSGDAVLRLAGITKRFGPLLANDAISLKLKKGEVVALLGENGAGKTTLMNILFGHYVADKGEIEVLGRPLQMGDPQAALSAGVGMVHQHFTLVKNMSVLENIVLGTESLFSLNSRKSVAKSRIQNLSAEFGLHVNPEALVSDLSVGERQRVEILKALYRDVKVLILDEPTAVLTPFEIESLFSTLRDLVGKGLSVIFITHKLREVLSACDRVVVLRKGRIVGERLTATVGIQELADLMVGEEIPAPPKTEFTPGAPVLELVRVSTDSARQGANLRDVSISLRSGSITGIAGVAGNGQSALASLLSGTSRPSIGEITINGVTVDEWSPRLALRNKIGRIPDDRLNTGVITGMSVTENIITEQYHTKKFRRWGLLNRHAATNFAERVIESYNVKCPSPESHIGVLSGGNIQKLVLGRALDSSPEIILANQPTRGLDVGAVAYVHERLLEARSRGAAILLISDDLEEILDLSNIIMVLVDGRVSAPSRRDELNVRELGSLMMKRQHSGAEKLNAA